VGIRELPFQLTLDLYGRSKLAANYAHALKTGVVAQQLSDCSFKRSQSLFDHPSFAHQPINPLIIFYLVHGNSFLSALWAGEAKHIEVVCRYNHCACGAVDHHRE
jgi:hypothetical protein